MNSYVVVEGKHDRLLWQVVMQTAYRAGPPQVVEGGGKYNAISLAETILFRRKLPVAFVADADTVDPGLAAQQRQEFRTLLRMAGPEELWCVELFMPEMERCFFAHPGLAATIFSMDERALELAEYAPKKVFLQMARKHWGDQADPHERFLQRLSAEQRKLLAADSTIAAVLDFLQRAASRSAA